MRTLSLIIVAGLATLASGQELLVNGDFETGDLTGWTPFNQLGAGDLFVTSEPAGSTALPFSFGFNIAPGPTGGVFYAVVDQNGRGAYSISQDFTVSPAATGVVLSFDFYNGDTTGFAPLNSGVLNGNDFSLGGTQWARIDLLNSAGAVIATFADTPAAFAYANFTVDITALVAGGGTFTLRYGHADNVGFFLSALDSVSVMQTTGPCNPADINGDGMINFGDVTAFLTFFNSGCP